MNVSNLPEKQWLETLFEYRPAEGLFWRMRPPSHFEKEVDWYIWNKRFAGKDAGTKPHKDRGNGIRKRDHRRVQLPIWERGPLRQFSVHRVVFAIMGVDVPYGQIIDHRDRDPWNNRWDNLRVATYKQNSQNNQGWRRRKHALPKGVYLDGREKPNPYYAKLKVGDKYEQIGAFPDVESAHQAYLKRAAEVHKDFMPDGSEKV